MAVMERMLPRLLVALVAVMVGGPVREISACGTTFTVPVQVARRGSVTPLASDPNRRPKHAEPQPIVLAYGSDGIYGDEGSAVNGDHYSPDGRYIVRAHVEMPNTSELTLMDARSRRALASIEDMNDFLWVPSHPHRLVVAAGGPFGGGFLRMWEGGRHWRSLYRVRRPKEEMFSLFGATRNGQFIIYGLGPSRDLESYDPPHVRRWMRLPEGASGGRSAPMPSEDRRLYLVARYMGQVADLRGVALPGANLVDVNLEGAVLKHANLAGTNFSRAKMGDANLERANLHTARLTGVDLLGVNLVGADLTGADLTGATLVKKGFLPTKLHAARFDKNTRWPAGFEPLEHGALLIR